MKNLTIKTLKSLLAKGVSLPYAMQQLRDEVPQTEFESVVLVNQIDDDWSEISKTVPLKTDNPSEDATKEELDAIMDNLGYGNSKADNSPRANEVLDEIMKKIL